MTTQVSVSDCNIQTFAAITVSTTAAPVVASAQAIKAHNVVRICAPAANTAAIYYGDSTVTTSTGQELAAGTDKDVFVRDGFKLYVIVASGTQNLRVCAM
jgi:hypothetical protein